MKKLIIICLFAAGTAQAMPTNPDECAYTLVGVPTRFPGVLENLTARMAQQNYSEGGANPRRLSGEVTFQESASGCAGEISRSCDILIKGFAFGGASYCHLRGQTPSLADDTAACLEAVKKMNISFCYGAGPKVSAFEPEASYTLHRENDGPKPKPDFNESYGQYKFPNYEIGDIRVTNTQTGQVAAYYGDIALPYYGLNIVGLHPFTNFTFQFSVKRNGETKTVGVNFGALPISEVYGVTQNGERDPSVMPFLVKSIVALDENFRTFLISYEQRNGSYRCNPGQGLCEAEHAVVVNVDSNAVLNKDDKIANQISQSIGDDFLPSHFVFAKHVSGDKTTVRLNFSRYDATKKGLVDAFTTDPIRSDLALDDPYNFNDDDWRDLPAGWARDCVTFPLHHAYSIRDCYVHVFPTGKTFSLKDLMRAPGDESEGDYSYYLTDSYFVVYDRSTKFSKWFRTQELGTLGAAASPAHTVDFSQQQFGPGEAILGENILLTIYGPYLAFLRLNEDESFSVKKIFDVKTNRRDYRYALGYREYQFSFAYQNYDHTAGEASVDIRSNN